MENSSWGGLLAFENKRFGLDLEMTPLALLQLILQKACPFKQGCSGLIFHQFARHQLALRRNQLQKVQPRR